MLFFKFQFQLVIYYNFVIQNFVINVVIQQFVSCNFLNSFKQFQEFFLKISWDFYEDKVLEFKDST